MCNKSLCGEEARSRKDIAGDGEKGARMREGRITTTSECYWQAWRRSREHSRLEEGGKILGQEWCQNNGKECSVFTGIKGLVGKVRCYLYRHLIHIMSDNSV